MDTSGAGQDRLDQVLGELATLRAENAAIREENQRLAARVDGLGDGRDGRQYQLVGGPHQPTPGDGDGSTTHGLSRRRLLTRLAGAGAFGAGVLAVGDTFAPRAARAAAGGNMVLGQVNDAGTAGTSLTAAPGKVATLNVLNTSSGGSGLYGQAVAASGLQGVGAVIGDTNQQFMSGVIGLNNNGTAVSGVGSLGVFANGSPGVFAIARGVGGDNSGVHGEGNPGVHGIAQTSDLVGVQGTVGPEEGTPASGTGVVAEVIGMGAVAPGSSSVGLLATNAGLGTGVKASSTGGRGIEAAGKLAQLQLTPAVGTHPASGATGDLFEESAGILWLCVGGTNWRKLGGLKTAGQLHVLPSPVRVYDSRLKDGPLADGQERTVSLTTGTNGTTPAVPAGAIASLFTLTIVNTGSQGFLAAFSNAVAWPGTSNIDWFLTNSILATSVTSAVDASAKIKVHCGGTKTDFVIDVTGYYQ